MIRTIINISICLLVLFAASCKKQSAVTPDASTDTVTKTLIDLSTTTLPGMHRWSGRIVGIDDSDDCYMLFGIVVVNDSTIVADRDTLRLVESGKGVDILKFRYYHYPTGFGPDQYTSELEVIYDVITKQTTYYNYLHTGYKGYTVHHEYNLHDTHITTPISLLAANTLHMTGVRFWKVHRTGTVSAADTVVSCAINVVDDSTIKTKSFWPDEPNASIAVTADDHILNYVTSDLVDQSVTFRSNRYILGGGSLTYYYAKDSMVYDFVASENSDGLFQFHLYTQ